MLENLNWDTLQYCRDQACLTMMYRIVHQLVDISVEWILPDLIISDWQYQRPWH